MKVQSRYRVSGAVGRRITRILPSLELSGVWFKAAGFQPGQPVSIEVLEGVLTIRLA